MDGVWEDVQETASADPRIRLLDDAAAGKVIERTTTIFLTAARPQWWWEAIRGPYESVQFFDYRVGLELLRSRIENEPIVLLIVTDSQREPRGVFSGPGDAITELIDNTYFFEYAVTDPEARWLILENHHDFLIFVGDVPPGLRLAQ